VPNTNIADAGLHRHERPDPNLWVTPSGAANPGGAPWWATRIGYFQRDLLEYQETITRLSGAARWQDVERFLSLLFSLNANVLFLEPQFRFGVIVADPDDNKFIDCAIAAQADYIITSDHHFAALNGSGYKPHLITPQEFIQAHL